MENSALSYASESKTPKEFIDKVTEFDAKQENIQKSFKNYLKTNPGNTKGIINRINQRQKDSLKISEENSKTSSVSVTFEQPKVIQAPKTTPIPTKNKPPVTGDSTKSQSVSVLNNTTNVIQGGTTYITEEDKNLRPALIEKTYYS